MCIHTYIHTYINTYIHKYIHTYMHTYIQKYTHKYTHTYTSIHTCVCVCMCVCVCVCVFAYWTVLQLLVCAFFLCFYVVLQVYYFVVDGSLDGGAYEMGEVVRWLDGGDGGGLLGRLCVRLFRTMNIYVCVCVCVCVFVADVDALHLPPCLPVSPSPPISPPLSCRGQHSRHFGVRRVLCERRRR